MRNRTPDDVAQAWYLTTSPLWRFVSHPTWGPYVLGIIVWALIVAAVILAPSSASRFIYTDF